MRISDSLKIFNFNTEQYIPNFSYTKQPEAISLYKEYKIDTSKNIDTYEKSITPQGVKNEDVLVLAPKPDIMIAGEKKKAGIIVDLSKNILFRYDKNGKPINAYLIASGKKSTPTDKGVRIVTHKEKFPYRGAPRRAKRRRAPKDYGPFIICLNKLDPKTGEQSSTGEFIHGCRSYEKTFESTPDRYVSHGCMRMDNEIIAILAKEVERGEIVIIK